MGGGGCYNLILTVQGAEKRGANSLGVGGGWMGSIFAKESCECSTLEHAFLRMPLSEEVILVSCARASQFCHLGSVFVL